ncbi:MAG TPA: hypothetical protein VGN22_05725 [Pseudonocardia sp.]
MTTVLPLSFPAAEIANDRRRVLLAEADAHRLARVATRGRPIRLMSALVRRGRSGGVARSGVVCGGAVAE